MANTIVPELLDVTLHASNVEELGHFYSSIGLRKAVDDEDVKVFILGVNELEIQRDGESVDRSASIQVQLHQVDQLEQLERRLQEAEIDYERAPLNDGLRVVVHDPNGNAVNFVAAHG